jgi:hypothetical protein
LHFDSYHAIVPVSPDEKEPKSLEVVIRLDRGRSVKGRVVGPDDQPLAGTGVLGLTAVIKVSHEDSERLEGPTFEAVALDSDQPRVLVFYHEQKKLGGTVTVRGDEREPVTVKLGAPGSLTGRVVDGDGKPAAGAEVMVAYHLDRKLRLPAELLVAGRGTLPDVIAVRPAKAGPDGRFRLDGLIPGLKYDLGFNSDERFSGWAKRAIVAGPGRTVEVGDVRAPAPGR